MEPDTPAAGQRRADALPQAPAMQAGRSRGVYAPDTEEDAVHASGFQPTNAATYGSRDSPEVQLPWTSDVSRDQHAQRDGQATRSKHTLRRWASALRRMEEKMIYLVKVDTDNDAG